MKTIGIIGGIGPESTVDYYKEIIAAFHTKYSDLAYPEIIVYSVNMNELLKFIETKNWPELSEWLLEKIFSLHRAGADFAAIASNTPHIIFDEIKTKSPIPLLSIVESTCNKAQEMGLEKCGFDGHKAHNGGGILQKTIYFKRDIRRCSFGGGKTVNPA